MHRSLACAHQARRHISRTTQCSSNENQQLLLRLRQNSELDADDAKNELRWMKQSLSDDRNGIKLASLVERRAKGEPLQYILGSTDFGPLTLKCRAPTLIPRPETADIFGRLAQLLSAHRAPSASPLKIVDLCTGSAPIPLLLRNHLRDQVRIIGYDISQSAIQLARENIESAGLDVEVHEADILDKCFSEKVRIDMGDQVDLVVSNPPYIPFDEYRELPASVRDYEDPAALLGDKTGGTSGLQFYERIAELLPTMLSTKKQVEEAGWKGIPRVAVEIGHLQGRDVSSIMRNGGMSRTEVWPDQYGKDRMVLGWD